MPSIYLRKERGSRAFSLQCMSPTNPHLFTPNLQMEMPSTSRTKLPQGSQSKRWGREGRKSSTIPNRLPPQLRTSTFLCSSLSLTRTAPNLNLRSISTLTIMSHPSTSSSPYSKTNKSANSTRKSLFTGPSISNPST